MNRTSCQTCMETCSGSFVHPGQPALPRASAPFYFADFQTGLKYVCDADRKLSDGPCSRAAVAQVIITQHFAVLSVMSLTNVAALYGLIFNTFAHCRRVSCSKLTKVTQSFIGRARQHVMKFILGRSMFNLGRPSRISVW